MDKNIKSFASLMRTPWLRYLASGGMDISAGLQVVTTSGMVVGSAFLLACGVAGDLLGFVCSLVVVMASATALLTHRLTGRVGLALDLMLAGVFVTIGLQTYFAGGLAERPPFWLIAMPMFASALGFHRRAMFWMIVSCVFVLALYLMELGGHAFPITEKTPLAASTEDMFVVISFLIAAYVLYSWNDLSRRRAILKLNSANEETKVSEKNFRLLIEQSPDPIVVHDRQRFLYANQAILDLLGYERGEFLDLPIMEFIFPDDLGVISARQAMPDKGDQPPNDEFRCRSKDGSIVLIEVHAYTTTFNGQQAQIVMGRDITQRRAIEDELRESEEQYRTLIEKLPYPLSIRHENRVIFMNHAALDGLGYDWEEAKGIPALNFIHPEDHDIVIKRQAAFDRGETLPAAEIRYLKRNGDIVISETHGYLPAVFDGQEVRIAVHRDLTESRKAEAALRQSEEQYRTLIEEIPDPVVIVLPDRRILMMNHAALEILGYEWNEAKTMNFLDFIHPEDHAILALKRIGIDQPELLPPVEIRYLKRDGSIVVGEAHGFPTVIDGQTAWIVVIRDVTARKKVEEKLQQLTNELENRVEDRTSELHASETKFRDLVETSQDLIFTFDVEGRFTYLNPAWKDSLEYELSEMLGHHFSEFKSPTTTESPHGYVLGGGTIESYETEYRSKSNEPVILLFKGKPRYDKDGVVIGTQGTAIDVTKQKQIETQLLESQKMELVGQLAGGIAHDFNNLLTVINGYSALNFDRLKPEDPLHHDLGEIMRAGERAAALTRQLLAFGRKQILHPEVINLGEIAVEMGNMLRRLIGEHVELQLRFEPDLQKIKADPGQMEQVIMNLVINARDAMQEGGNISVSVENVELDELGELPAGGYIMLSVSDTGIGMNEETLSHIFEPFYTTKAVGKGTGLGLSTVFGIAKQSGGEIVVESDPGNGTTFRIYLPRVEASTPAEAKESAAFPIEGNETILLVEDEDIIRELLKRILERLGYTVLAARHGREALLTAENHQGPINLMITDVVMPQMGGHELVERLSPFRPEMSVLYMSGYDDEIVVDQGIGDSGKLFLQKPFGPKAVGKKIREMLDKPATAR